MTHETELDTFETLETSKGSRLLNWSSLGFAFLQSVCLALVSLSGIRTAIGLSSLFVAGGVYPAIMRLHTNAVRVPMMCFALGGSLLTLFIVWQARRLRARPAAAWRAQHTSAVSTKSEHMQVLLSVFTLVLVLVEFVLHKIVPH